MKYTAIFFDVGGTLMSMDRERVAREYVALAHARGVEIDQTQAHAMFAALDDEIPKRARLAPPLSLNARAGERFWKTLFADGWSRLALPRDRASVEHLYLLFRRGDFNRLFDDTRPALDALKTHGLALGILSNFTRNCIDVLRTLGIVNYFSFFAVSSIVRKEKPERAIFDYAVRAAKRPAGEILHIGDSIHADVDGARAAGLSALLLDRDNWYPEYATVPRIRRLTELVDWL